MRVAGKQLHELGFCRCTEEATPGSSFLKELDSLERR